MWVLSEKEASPAQGPERMLKGIVAAKWLPGRKLRGFSLEKDPSFKHVFLFSVVCDLDALTPVRANL